MASLRTGCGNIKEAVMGSGQLEQSCITLKDTEDSAVSSGEHVHPVDTRQRKILPGDHPENSLIVREALRMNLPRHLVLWNVCRRVQTHGANYKDVKELVANLFAADDRSCITENHEVPMETNQLEDALMMDSLVVKRALRMGVPPHIIRPKLRTRILSSGVGYADINELLKDLNVN